MSLTWHAGGVCGWRSCCATAGSAPSATDMAASMPPPKSITSRPKPKARRTPGTTCNRSADHVILGRRRRSNAPEADANHHDHTDSATSVTHQIYSIRFGVKSQGGNARPAMAKPLWYTQKQGWGLFRLALMQFVKLSCGFDSHGRMYLNSAEFVRAYRYPLSWWSDCYRRLRRITRFVGRDQEPSRRTRTVPTISEIRPSTVHLRKRRRLCCERCHPIRTTPPAPQNKASDGTNP